MEVLVVKKEGTWVVSILYNHSIWGMYLRTTTSTTAKSPLALATARYEKTNMPLQCQVVRRTKVKRKRGQKLVKFLDSLKCPASQVSQTYSPNN